MPHHLLCPTSNSNRFLFELLPNSTWPYPLLQTQLCCQWNSSQFFCNAVNMEDHTSGYIINDTTSQSSLTCLRMQKLISLLALVLLSCRCCLMTLQSNAPATSLCDVFLDAACVDVLKLRLEQEKQQHTQHNKKNIYKNMTNRASLEAPPAISSRVSSYKKIRVRHTINQVFSG